MVVAVVASNHVAFIQSWDNKDEEDTPCLTVVLCLNKEEAAVAFQVAVVAAVEVPEALWLDVAQEALSLLNSTSRPETLVDKRVCHQELLANRLLHNRCHHTRVL